MTSCASTTNTAAYRSELREDVGVELPRQPRDLILQQQLAAFQAPQLQLILRATAPGFCSGIDLKESREASSDFALLRVSTMHRYWFTIM